MIPMPTPTAHASAVQGNLREQIESVQPGASGMIDRAQLGLSEAEFESTLELLRDLAEAGAIRLGEIEPGRVEFERLR
jgi:hypothetical protein